METIGRLVLARRQPHVPPSGGSLEIGNLLEVWDIKVLDGCVVPPSGGSLEIGNFNRFSHSTLAFSTCSPFGGIPRNWKHSKNRWIRLTSRCSPFGGIPRNWKHFSTCRCGTQGRVPPSGGSLEIGNCGYRTHRDHAAAEVPPSGGSLEIGNK